MDKEMINLRIITPDKGIMNQDSTDFFHVTLSSGYPISIYPGHAPLIAMVAQCTLKYGYKQKINQYLISEGFIKVKDNSINCFVNWAEEIEIKNSYD